jgi:hypothetical protein
MTTMNGGTGGVVVGGEQPSSVMVRLVPEVQLPRTTILGVPTTGVRADALRSLAAMTGDGARADASKKPSTARDRNQERNT